MIYVVTGDQIIVFEKAVEAKPSGAGHVVHVIGANNLIIGNFPVKGVKYYGTELPTVYQQQYDEQVRWDALTDDQKDAERIAHRKRREAREQAP